MLEGSSLPGVADEADAARSARDDRADHHESEYHEEQDQAEFRVIRHLLLRALTLPFVRCNHNLPASTHA